MKSRRLARRLIRTSISFVFILIAIRSSDVAHAQSPLQNVDAVVYGATPSGVAASIALGRRLPHSQVVLITPYRRVGGMITNGLTHPDFRTFEARTGLFRELNQRVEQHYAQVYGEDSPQVRDSLQGTHAGPEVNYRVLQEMLEELPGIKIVTQHRLHAVSTGERAVTGVELLGPNNTSLRFAAEYFVDASYEGDLMAASGVTYRIGREGRDEYGESLAPPEGDQQLQGYNFRLTMTDRPANRASVPKPPGYQADDFVDLLPLLRNGAIQRVFGDPFMNLAGGIYKRQTPGLPNGKRDINDVSHSLVRLSLPNANNAWPTGDWQVRQRIFEEHMRHNVGMLYFLQHDSRVPAKFQAEARRWGLCRDELAGTAHLPEQLYVREARRMVGRYVFTQRDTEPAPGSGDVRAIFHADAIAMGDYGPNCHGTFHEGPRFGGRHTGEFYQATAPYQIPYGTLLPHEFDNLAVPVACSASHVGFCALRLEPIWMSLGQATGEAVAWGLESKRSLPEISAAAIRERLHETGAATIYTADVSEESADFPAVQWWGGLGGLIALDRVEKREQLEYGTRGAHLVGQYYEAFPQHRVGMEQALSEPLRKAWRALVKEHLLFSDEASSELDFDSPRTRGDFIRLAWKYHRSNQP